MLAYSGPRVATIAVFISHAANWRGWSRGRRRLGRGRRLAEHTDVVRSAIGVLSGVSVLAVFVGHTSVGGRRR